LFASTHESVHGSLCSFEVDDQIELGWLLNREVGWLGSAQDFVDMFGAAPVEDQKSGP
jgi:hypothetical protein